MCIDQSQNEKTEEIIQVVFAAYFLQQNINMKYEKWVSLCQNEVINKNNTSQLHGTFYLRRGLQNQTYRKQIFMTTTCTLKMKKSATEIFKK